MSHNLFNERFFSYRETPWHKLGIVSEKAMGAMDAWTAINPYIVTMENLVIADDTTTNVPYRAIVRSETPDDPTKRVFGIVGTEYMLIDPQTICEIYDRAVAQPVETIGALGRGETLFISTKLPEIDVKGDQVETYMLIDSPYVGNESVKVRVTPIRTVCENTLMAARRQTTEMYAIIHDKDADKRLESWMAGLYQRAVTRAATLSQFFGILADYKPSVEKVDEMITTIYPGPKDPRENARVPEEVAVARLNDYEYFMKAAQRNRTAVQELFNGRGTGMDLVAAKGTGWGLYNAVSEWESWRQTTKPLARAENLLFGGDRGNVIESAYSIILDNAIAA